MNLSNSQIEAVTHGEGPLLVTAGAGSGKTRTLTQRVIHLIKEGVRPGRIVAITFTNKAAKEMRDRIFKEVQKSRLRGGPPFIGTFHAFSARILRKEARKTGRAANYVIFDDDDSLKVMKKVVKSLNLPEGHKYSAAALRKIISNAKIELADPSSLDEVTQEAYKDYESRLAEQNAFDFDDLIEKTVKLFLDHPGVLKKHQQRFDYILVDEYQDINQIQYTLIRLLAQEHKNINVVGDDQQSIYAFRGANIKTFLGFEKDWPKTKIVHLGQNYRSSANIVRAAAGIIDQNRFQIKKELWTENAGGSPVRVTGTRSADEEADSIAEAIKGGGFRESAVLYRTNAQSRALEQALNFHAVPYEVFGNVKFYERREIKDVLAPLRYALNPRDQISRERIVKTFRKAAREELLQTLPELRGELSLMELIGFTLKTTDYFEYLARKFENAEDRVENVRELVNFAAGFDTLEEFIERVSLLQASDKLDRAAEEAPVKLMTIHLAKGLEFDDVYIAGVNEGTLPHHRSYFSEEDLEEERRLIYVAMTRARERLTMSFYSLASRFLYEIPPELVKFETADQPEEDAIYLD